MTELTITYLEMRHPKELRAKPSGDPRFRVLECTTPQWEFNRFLYWTVGEAWNWRDKRGWSEAQWRAHAEAPNLRTFAAYHDGSPAGYFELRTEGSPAEVEILYFGLLPAFLGRGLGGALLTYALEEAWKVSPARVWLHTCSADHPAALQNYLARGLRIYNTEWVLPGSALVP